MRSFEFVKIRSVSRFGALAILVSALLAGACGFRGPLYLPAETPPPATPDTPQEPSVPVGIDDSSEVEPDDEEERD